MLERLHRVTHSGKRVTECDEICHIVTKHISDENRSVESMSIVTDEDDFLVPIERLEVDPVEKFGQSDSRLEDVLNLFSGFEEFAVAFLDPVDAACHGVDLPAWHEVPLEDRPILEGQFRQRL